MIGELFLMLYFSIGLFLLITERPLTVLERGDTSLMGLPSWNMVACPKSKKCFVWLINGYPPYHMAGSEVGAHAINRRLIEEGHECWVGVPGFPHKTYEGVYLFDMRDRTMLNWVLQRADVLASTSVFKAPALQLAERFGCVFIDFINTGAGRREYWENLPFPKDRFFVVYNTNWMKENYKRAWPHQHFVLHPPIHWANYSVETPAKDRKYITLINCNENKGGYLLLQIARRLPNVQFAAVIGGYGEQIIDRSLPNVHYFPHTPNIQEIYAMTRILLVLSDWETYGRVAVEAMSSGIVVIASPIVGIREACGSSAVLCDRNVDAIVPQINSLLNDPILYDVFSNKGRQHVRSMQDNDELTAFTSWFSKAANRVDRKTKLAPKLLGLWEKILPIDRS